MSWWMPIECCSLTDNDTEILKTITREHIFIEKADIQSLPSDIREKNSIGTTEFAGMKFQGKYNSGDQYLSHVEKLVQKILKDLPNAHHLSISEEKYSFTPDLFKGPTHRQRATKKDSAISIHHLKRGYETSFTRLE